MIKRNVLILNINEYIIFTFEIYQRVFIIYFIFVHLAKGENYLNLVYRIIIINIYII